jgi:hypothetical protein
MFQKFERAASSQVFVGAAGDVEDLPNKKFCVEINAPIQGYCLLI